MLGEVSGAIDAPKRYLLARGISVAASLGSLLLIYFLGMRWNHRTALMAFAFLSASMVAVREAHWANPEPLSAFWILLACLILFYLEKHNSALLFMLLGASIALGVASKYFAAFFLHLPILAALITDPQFGNSNAGWRRYWENLRRNSGKVILSYVSFGLVVFLTLGVYIVRDTSVFLQAYEAHAPWAAHNGLYGIFPKPVSVPAYIAAVLPISLGVPLFISSIIGIIFSVFARKKASLVLIACILPLWIFLECIQYHPLRFCLSLTPVLCLFAAIFFDLAMSHRSQLLSSLAGVVMLATLIYSGMVSYGFISGLNPRNDTRLLATEWLETHGARMEQVALLGGNTQANSLGFIKYEGMDRVSGSAYPFFPVPPEYIVVLKNVGHILSQHRRLTQAGYRYSKDDWYPMVDPSAQTFSLFYDLSKENGYRLVKEFDASPHFGRMRFYYEPLKFDLALTNLDISIYQRSLD